MKKTISIILIAWVAITLGACSRITTRPEQVLIIGLENEVQSLDPILINETYTARVAWQIYEGLVELDANNNLVPALAETWSTSDYKVWRFKIRSNVYFHKSDAFKNPDRTRAVEAEDVRYSFERFCRPESFSAFVFKDIVEGASEFGQGKIDRVSGFKAISKDTFEVVLKTPEPSFIYRLANPSIAVFPKEAVEFYGDRFGKEVAVGTGPFRLESKGPTQVVLVRNENYWNKGDADQLPHLRKIIFNIIKNDQIRFSELKGGRIDVMSVPTQLVPELFDEGLKLKEVYSKNYSALITPLFDIYFIGFNLKNPKVSDVHFRRAIYYGINRKEIVDRVLRGTGSVSVGFIPDGMQGYRAPKDDVYNPEMAEIELAKSGSAPTSSTPETELESNPPKLRPSKQLRGYSLEILVHDKANSEQVAQIIQDQLKRIGIEVKLKKLDYNTVISNMIKGDAEAFSMWFEYIYPAPELLFETFMSNKIPVPNFWHYSSKVVDEKLNELARLTSREEINKKASQIEQIIIQDVPAVFLYNTKNVVLISKKVEGYRVNGLNRHILKEVRISP